MTDEEDEEVSFYKLVTLIKANIDQELSFIDCLKAESVATSKRLLIPTCDLVKLIAGSQKSNDQLIKLAALVKRASVENDDDDFGDDKETVFDLVQAEVDKMGGK